MAPRRQASQAPTQSLESHDTALPATRQQKSKSPRQPKAAPPTLVSNRDYYFTWIHPFLVTASLTLALQAVFSAIIDQATGKELGNVSRHLNSIWSNLGLMGWKFAELGVGWYAGYGNVGIAPFIALLRLPNVYLLNAHYEVSYMSLLVELVSNFSSAALAFSIYRRPDVYKGPRGTPVVDSTLRSGFVLPICATYFSAALYGLILLFSLYTWLPTHLALFWDGLRTLESAYDVGLLKILKNMIGMGWCTMYLLLGYTRSVFEEGDKNSDSATKEDDTESGFDPVTASLREHILHNINNLLLWRNTKPAGRSLLRHTAFLALSLTTSAAFQSCATIEGCETAGVQWLLGPLPWGLMWGLGMLASGVGLGWMAGVLS